MAQPGDDLDPLVMKRIQQKVNSLILRGLRIILDSSALEKRIRDVLASEAENLTGDTLPEQEIIYMINAKVADEVKLALMSSSFKKTVRSFVFETINESDVLSPERLDEMLLPRLEEIEAMLKPEPLRNRLRAVTREDLEERLADFEALLESSGEQDGLSEATVDGVVRQVMESLSVTFAKVESALRQKIEKGEKALKNLRDEFTGELDRKSVEIIETLETKHEDFLDSPGAAAKIENIIVSDVLRGDPIPRKSELVEIMEKQFEERAKSDAEEAVKHTLEVLEITPEFVDKIEKVVNERLSSLSMDMMNQVQLNTVAALDKFIEEKFDAKAPAEVEKALKSVIKGLKDEVIEELSDLSGEMVKFALSDERPVIVEDVTERVEATVKSLMAKAGGEVQDQLIDAFTSSLEDEIGKKATDIEKRVNTNTLDAISSLEEKLVEEVETHIADKAKENREALDNRLNEFISESDFANKIREEVRPIRDEMRQRLRDELSYAIREQVGDAVEDFTGRERERMEKTLTKTLSDKMESTVDEAREILKTEIHNAVTDSIKSDFEDLIAELRTEISEKLLTEHGEVLEKVDDKFKAKMSVLDKKIAEDISASLYERVDDKVSGMRRIIEDAVRDRLDEDVREFVRKNVEDLGGNAPEIDPEKVKELARDVAKDEIEEELSVFRGLFEKQFQEKIDVKLEEFGKIDDDKILEKVQEVAGKHIHKSVSEEIVNFGGILEKHLSDNVKAIVDKKVFAAVDDLITKKVAKEFSTLGSLLEKHFEEKLIGVADSFVTKKVAKEFGALGNILEQYFDENILKQLDRLVEKKIIKQFGVLGEQIENQITGVVSTTLEKMLITKLEEMMKAERGAFGEELVEKVSNHVEKGLLEKVGELFDKKLENLKDED